MSTLVEVTKYETIVVSNVGVPGPYGPSGTLQIGQVTTVPPGEQASVQNVGTPQNAILNMSLPQGVKGDRGEPGETSFETEYVTVTQSMIDEKKYLLQNVPAGDLKRVELQIQGMLPQFYGSDYYVVGTEIRWDGCALELLLAVNDKLKIQYPV